MWDEAIPVLRLFHPLTDARREFLAKTIMDVVKFAAGAGVISGFFSASPWPVRVVIGVGVLVFFVIAWALHPPKGGR
jgi:hypothetical protein